MRRNPGYVPDLTGDIAVADVAGDSVLASILSRITAERDRVLILAHVGLDISLASLARDLKTDPRKLAERVDQIVARLATDKELRSTLGDMRRAGRSEHYQALAFRLNLQDWFCSQCAQFMIQPQTGRPRKTCSLRCRRLLAAPAAPVGRTSTSLVPGRAPKPAARIYRGTRTKDAASCLN